MVLFNLVDRSTVAPNLRNLKLKRNSFKNMTRLSWLVAVRDDALSEVSVLDELHAHGMIHMIKVWKNQATSDMNIVVM